jgi:hypothetical protein
LLELGVLAIYKRGQTWSVDLLLGVTVFLAMFIGFYALMSVTGSRGSNRELRFEAENVANTIASEQEGFVGSEVEEVTFIESGQIDVGEYESLARQLSTSADGEDAALYEEVRRIIGSKRNFCIYLEDEEGNLVPVRRDPVSNEYVFGVGSHEALLGEGDLKRACNKLETVP